MSAHGEMRDLGFLPYRLLSDGKQKDLETSNQRRQTHITSLSSKREIQEATGPGEYEPTSSIRSRGR